MTQRAMHEQLRCLKVEVETMHSVVLTPDDLIWPWMVRHCSCLIERFRVRSNGLRFNGDLLVFGVVAFFCHSFAASGRATKKRKFCKADVRFERGILSRTLKWLPPEE